MNRGAAIEGPAHQSLRGRRGVMQIDGIDITWLGHSTFWLTTPEGKHILVDPWTRTSPVCPERYHHSNPDLIPVTHGHNDHTADLVEVAQRSGAPVVSIYEIAMFLAKKGVTNGLGMNKGGTQHVAMLNLGVSMTNAHHSSAFFDDEGNITY